MPAALFLAGNMLDPAVLFGEIDAPVGYNKVICDWLAGPVLADLNAVSRMIAEEVENLHDRPLILVGHSLGGFIAMLTSLGIPDYVDGVMLIDTGAHAEGNRNSDMPRRVREEFGVELVSEFIDRCHARPLKADVRQSLIKYALNGSPDQYLNAFVSIRRIDLRTELRNIRCPSVVVHGLLDQIRPLSQAAELVDGINDCELVLSESGHSPPLEDPDTVQGALDDLAARVAIKGK